MERIRSKGTYYINIYRQVSAREFSVAVQGLIRRLAVYACFVFRPYGAYQWKGILLKQGFTHALTYTRPTAFTRDKVLHEARGIFNFKYYPFQPVPYIPYRYILRKA